MPLQLAYIGAAFFLVLLNAFFVLAEFAIVKVRITRLRELAEKGSRNARLAVDINQRLDAYLSVCQLGVTVASLGLGWIGEPAFAKLLEPLLLRFGSWSPAISHSVAFFVAFNFVTLIHVVIGELAPKTVAIRYSERAALFSARPLRWTYLVTYPAMWILNATSNLVLRILRVPRGSEQEMAHSEEELKMILGASHDQGAFTLSRLLMMENVLDFGTLAVSDVMIPAEKVTFLDPTRPWPENLALIRKSMHSRYPLKEARVTRQVHIKDIALALADKGAVDLGAIARPAHAVPPGLPLESLLKHFHESATHLAVVEQEGLRGIVAFEDVIEELVGTIRDEFEKAQDYRLGEIVPPEGVVLEMMKQPKDSAIRTLVERLVRGRPGIDAAKAVATIMKREKLASTGLGEGIAIPHGRIEGLTRPCAALGRIPEGIDFQSLDGKPVHLMFLILTPFNDEGAHVHILEKISTLLSSDYLREQLRTATTIEGVFEVFKLSDKSLQA